MSMEFEVGQPISIDIAIAPLPQIDITTAASGAVIALLPVPGAPGPRGQPGTNVAVVGESPSGVRDGGNAAYTLLNNYVSGSTAVYRNGIRGKRGFDYDEWPPNRIAFSEAPEADHEILVDYIIL